MYTTKLTRCIKIKIRIVSDLKFSKLRSLRSKRKVKVGSPVALIKYVFSKFKLRIRLTAGSCVNETPVGADSSAGLYRIVLVEKVQCGVPR